MDDLTRLAWTRTDPDGPGRTRKDPDGPRWTRMDQDGPGHTRTDPEGPGRTRTDPDGLFWLEDSPLDVCSRRCSGDVKQGVIL